MIEQIELNFFEISTIQCALENFKNKMLIEQNERMLFQIEILQRRFNNYELSYNQNYDEPRIVVLSNINENIIDKALIQEIDRLSNNFIEIINNVGVEMFVDAYNEVFNIKDKLQIAYTNID